MNFLESIYYEREFIFWEVILRAEFLVGQSQADRGPGDFRAIPLVAQAKQEFGKKPVL